MAYIGRSTDKLSNIEKLDTIVFDGSSSYTLQKNSVNFTPSSANSLQVSIDGVVQAGNFTVSGSTIDFGVAIPSTSTNDFIFHYGIGLITTPADGTVTTAKLADSSVTSAKLSGITQGITEADQWRVTANITANADPVSANLERVDNTGFGYIGTGMSVSSGTWTFPSTGLWLIIANANVQAIADDNVYLAIEITTNNSTYTLVTRAICSGDGGAIAASTSDCKFFFNVTDTSTHKVRFNANSITSGSYFQGDTDESETYFTFIRLGDSV